MLKKVISVLAIIISIILLVFNQKEIRKYEEKVDNIINDKNINRKYVGYISYLDKKILIKTGDNNEVLDSNLVLMMNNESLIENDTGNIVLAGHNNKYVFSSLYNLRENDEVVFSDFRKDYIYVVKKIDFVNIKDKYILDNVYDKKILTLITCTSNNQIRYVITCEFKKMSKNK